MRERLVGLAILCVSSRRFTEAPRPLRRRAARWPDARPSFFAALPTEGDQPAQREGVGTARLDLDRHLVGGTADASALTRGWA